MPHLYPLVKLAAQYPRYAAVVLDTHQARIVVFGLGEVEKAEVTNVKTRRSAMGGWSQARYQRRAENFHLHHVKEVVETLDKIVPAENIQHIVIAGDEVVVPLVKEQLPQRLMDKLADIVRLDNTCRRTSSCAGRSRRFDRKTPRAISSASERWSAPGRPTVSAPSDRTPC